MTRVVLGIDIGGTKALARAERHQGKLRVQTAESRIAWSEPRVDRDIATLCTMAGAALAGVGAHTAHVVSAAFPGTLDASGIVRRWPTRPGWSGLELREVLGRFGRPIIDDDALLAARAEAAALHDGAASLLYLGLGTGVGGGFVPAPDVASRAAAASADGDARWPRAAAALEAGHLLVWPDGAAPCDCGRHGCLQAYASGPALARRAGVTGPAVAGEEAVEALAIVAANLAETHAPAVVVLGGGVAAGWPALPAAVDAAVARRLRHGSTRPRIGSAVYGTRSSLVGAVSVARIAARSLFDRQGRP